MKVAVLIKQTPDTAELPKVVADDVRAGKVKATMVINPWDEYAAEEAIQLGDLFRCLSQRPSAWVRPMQWKRSNMRWRWV